MNEQLQNLSKALADKIKNQIEGIEWSTASMTMSMTDSMSLSGGLVMVHLNEVEVKRFVLKGFASFYTQIVTSYEIAKWNESKIVVYPDGRFESSFTFNEVAQLNQQIKTVQLAFDSLYESIFEQISFELLPEQDWKQAIATVLIRDGKIDSQSTIQVEGHAETYPIHLDNFWQREIPRFQKITNTEPLSAYFPAWNTLIYQLRYEDNFDLDKDLEYQMRDIS